MQQQHGIKYNLKNKQTNNIKALLLALYALLNHGKHKCITHNQTNPQWQ